MTHINCPFGRNCPTCPKCRYTWLQFKENETSTIFANIESVFETSISNFLHDRHSQRELEAQSKHSSKWHSLTTAFTKLMKPSVDDLHVAFPVGTPTLVRFQF